MKSIKQIRENYNIITEKEEADIKKLVALGRAGLFDMKKANFIKRALEKDPKDMTLSERKVLIELLDELMSQVLHSNQIYSKVKQNVRNVNENLAKYDSRFEKNFNKSESKALPVTIILRRKAIRIYPDNQKVGLYYSQLLDKYITIPFGPDDASISAINEANIVVDNDSNSEDQKDKSSKPKKSKPPSAQYQAKSGVKSYFVKKTVSSLNQHIKQDKKDLGDALSGKGNYISGAAAAGGLAGNLVRQSFAKRRLAKKMRAASDARKKSSQSGQLAQINEFVGKVIKQGAKVLLKSKSGKAPVAKPGKPPVKTQPKPSDTPATVPTPTTPVKPPAPAPKPQPKKVEPKPKAEPKTKNDTKTKTETTPAPSTGAKPRKNGLRKGLRRLGRRLGGASGGDAPAAAAPDLSGKEITPLERDAETKINKPKRFDTTRARRKQDEVLGRKVQKTMIEEIKTVTEQQEFSINNGKIIINKQIAEKLLSLYESVNKDNKKKIESMLSESVDSFKKIVEFAVRQ